jgi:hypothetical protein
VFDLGFNLILALWERNNELSGGDKPAGDVEEGGEEEEEGGEEEEDKEDEARAA